MKSFGRTALLGAALAASTSFALADTIAFGQLSLAGTDTYTANSISFAPGTTTVGEMVLTGTLAPYFTDGASVTMTNFNTGRNTCRLRSLSVTENSETFNRYFLHLLSRTSRGGSCGDLIPATFNCWGQDTSPRRAR